MPQKKLFNKTTISSNGKKIKDTFVQVLPFVGAVVGAFGGGDIDTLDAIQGSAAGSITGTLAKTGIQNFKNKSQQKSQTLLTSKDECEEVKNKVEGEVPNKNINVLDNDKIIKENDKIIQIFEQQIKAGVFQV